MTLGYKETAIGPIPEDWQIGVLRDLVDPVRTIRYGIVQPGPYDPSGRYMIRGQDYSRGWVDPSELFRVSAKIEEPFANARVRAGDVRMTIVGASTGRIAVVPPWLDGANLTQTTARIALRPDRANGLFCAYALTGPIGSQQVSNYLKGAAQPGLNCGDIERFVIPLPPRAEQDAIAQAVGDVDALLEGLMRLIAKKRDLKRAAMQQLLTGRTRLPGFTGIRKVKRICDVGEVRSGGTPSTSQSRFWNGDVPWCTPTDITALDGRKYLTCTARTISAVGLQSSSAELIPARSLIMTSRATVGECAINLVPIATSQGFKNIVPFDAVDVEFLYYLMATQKAGLLALCGGSTFLEIGKKQIAEYEITLPIDRDEQTAIAAVLSDMDAELVVLEARRAKTQALKQAMMQELLTGRIRLVPPEPAHA